MQIYSPILAALFGGMIGLLGFCLAAVYGLSKEIRTLRILMVGINGENGLMGEMRLMRRRNHYSNNVQQNLADRMRRLDHEEIPEWQG